MHLHRFGFHSKSFITNKIIQRCFANKVTLFHSSFSFKFFFQAFVLAFKADILIDSYNTQGFFPDCPKQKQ